MCTGLLQLSLLAKISEKLNGRLPAALIGNMITNITIILPTSLQIHVALSTMSY